MSSYNYPQLSTSLGAGSYVANLLNQTETDRAGDSSYLRPQKPRILLMGLRRSGKSSIIKVVFHKMAPNDTLYLESTNRVEKDDISTHSFVKFQVWEFPGQLDILDPTFDAESLFVGCNALIYIIDSQDEYFDSLNKLRRVISRAFPLNQRCHFEIFVHKVDGLADDDRSQIQTSIMHRVIEDLAGDNIRAENGLNLSFHLTSIYDHSIFEAFSRVVQKLIPNLGTLEMLLDIFNRNSNIYKSFLFDISSKIYIATDSTPVDMQSYEICCDMIDLFIDVSWIYGSSKQGFYDQLPFDNQSQAVIRLNNNILLYLREVNTYLGLVSLMRDDAFTRQGIIDYNFGCLKKAISDVFGPQNAVGGTAASATVNATPSAIHLLGVPPMPSANSIIPTNGAINGVSSPGPIPINNK